MKSVVAYILAGGTGSRLNVLVGHRAKPAVPFGGHYRLIDFTLSNLLHSGVLRIGVLTQYSPYSLMEHIGHGEAWDYIGRSRSIKVLPPSIDATHEKWYRGTADAIAQNLEFAQRYQAAQVLVVSGDHIYKMDYQSMLDFHRQKKADMTIATIRVPQCEISNFGIAETNAQKKITKWAEKPAASSSNLASMGVYIFDMNFLKSSLAHSLGVDFGYHFIQEKVSNSNIYAYPFEGYWVDVGTLRSYWKANMDILRSDSGLDLRHWDVRTNLNEGLIGDRAPALFSGEATVVNSVVSAGCIVEGYVKNSIISPGVHIQSGAKVIDSIIMHDSIVCRNAQLYEVICDKKVVFGHHAHVGIGENNVANQKFPNHLFTGLTLIGKAAKIPENIKICKNTIIEAFTTASSFDDAVIKPGSYIGQTRKVENEQNGFDEISQIARHDVS